MLGGVSSKGCCAVLCGGGCQVLCPGGSQWCREQWGVQQWMLAWGSGHACLTPPNVSPDVAEPTGSIEVEAKFMVGPGTEARLVVLGAVLAGAVSFQDQYYDTPDGRLTLADHWLRHREGAGWELKCPPWPAGGARDPGYGPGATSQDGSTRAATSLNPGAPAQPPGSTTAYQELTSPAAVVARLCAILAVAPDPGWACIPVAVAGLGLEVFAAFRTQRRSYRLGRLSVDLDEADFGYAVGEVETAVTHPWEVPAAQEEVTRVGRELGEQLWGAEIKGAPETSPHLLTISPNPSGVEVTGPVMGKMSVYLQQYRPQHYEELVQAGRLVRDKMPMGGRD